MLALSELAVEHRVPIGFEQAVGTRESVPSFFGVTTKSHLGANSALSVNSVKRSAFKKACKNQKTAYVRGILIDGLVPKGGLEPPRVASHAPQTCASASSATSARVVKISNANFASASFMLARYSTTMHYTASVHKDASHVTICHSASHVTVHHGITRNSLSLTHQHVTAHHYASHRKSAISTYDAAN
jgi:hypothetical protein